MACGNCMINILGGFLDFATAAEGRYLLHSVPAFLSPQRLPRTREGSSFFIFEVFLFITLCVCGGAGMCVPWHMYVVVPLPTELSHGSVPASPQQH